AAPAVAVTMVERASFMSLLLSVISEMSARQPTAIKRTHGCRIGHFGMSMRGGRSGYMRLLPPLGRDVK
ncbi:hypothetical protein ACIQB5_50865, partial [Streptomyces sp. NPDC088560]|uniref:hypothetical protein n=1 Tax=Streptomyces sp. NPDC088560 TaxID=3365868 RepID=UPI0038289677